MTVETLSPLVNSDVNYRQVIMPNHQSGSFLGDDTDNHDFIFRDRGKTTPQIDIDNPTDAELTWTLYGMHEVDGAPGDPGTYEIDSGAIATVDQMDDVWCGYAFPFFLLRLNFAVAPTDDPAETVSVFINLAAGGIL